MPSSTPLLVLADPCESGKQLATKAPAGELRASEATSEPALTHDLQLRTYVAQGFFEVREVDIHRQVALAGTMEDIDDLVVLERAEGTPICLLATVVDNERATGRSILRILWVADKLANSACNLEGCRGDFDLTADGQRCVARGGLAQQKGGRVGLGCEDPMEACWCFCKCGRRRWGRRGEIEQRPFVGLHESVRISCDQHLSPALLGTLFVG